LASCGRKFTQTLFSDSFTGINPENYLTFIRLFYNYFLTDNPDLHAVMVAHITLFVYLLGLSRSPFPVAIENLEHVHDLKKAIWNEYQNDLRNVVDPHHVILY
jgi:hypothetical protein